MQHVGISYNQFSAKKLSSLSNSPCSRPVSMKSSENIERPSNILFQESLSVIFSFSRSFVISTQHLQYIHCLIISYRPMSNAFRSLSTQIPVLSRPLTLESRFRRFVHAAIPIKVKHATTKDSTLYRSTNDVKQFVVDLTACPFL